LEARHEGASATVVFRDAPQVTTYQKGTIMRAYSIGGLILIVLGVLALLVRSVTYYTEETVVGPLGFFAWDVERPHTVFISPIAGMVAIAIGLVLLFMTRRTSGT
jgi:hypothetical protein